MKNLFCTLTSLCLFVGVFTSCEKPNENNEGNDGTTPGGGTTTEQFSSIQGKITDKRTGEPLAGVTITLQPTDKQVQTAEDGTYHFDSLEIRRYTLKAQKDGYIDYTKEEIQLETGYILLLNIAMSEQLLEFQILDKKDNAIEELECFGTECSFKLVNTGNIEGGWSIESDVDWITEISPASGSLAAGASETLTIKKKLQKEDKETVLSIKTDKEELHLKIVGRGFAEIEMVYVEGGEFEMGATAEQGDDAQDNERPVRTVKLDSYHIGKYEITQAQWKSVMGTEPSVFKGDNLPVEMVSWIEAQEFCKRLSEATGKKYTLPTEAQWEYAARGGNKSQHYKYAGSNDIDEVAWYENNSGRITHPVGTKKANELGIYDMSGNVYEWCSDWYGDYDENDTENPQGVADGAERVLRGGYWRYYTWGCRVSYRSHSTPDDQFALGFRVACISE